MPCRRPPRSAVRGPSPHSKPPRDFSAPVLGPHEASQRQVKGESGERRGPASAAGAKGRSTKRLRSRREQGPRGARSGEALEASGGRGPGSEELSKQAAQEGESLTESGGAGQEVRAERSVRSSRDRQRHGDTSRLEPGLTATCSTSGSGFGAWTPLRGLRRCGGARSPRHSSSGRLARGTGRSLRCLRGGDPW